MKNELPRMGAQGEPRHGRRVSTVSTDFVGHRSPMLCKLAIVEICIKSIGCKQTLMIALLYNLSIFHNKDNIRFPDGRQTMSHYKTGSALHHGKERFLNLNLCIIA